MEFKKKYKDNNPNILWETWYEKNGKKQGEYTLYYDDGNIWRQGSYDDGLRDGKWKYLHENGKPSIEWEYKKGLLVSKKLILYYENGRVEAEYIISKNKENKIDGRFKYWYENGNPKAEGYCSETPYTAAYFPLGHIIPIYIEKKWYEDGNIKEEYFYKNNKRVRMINWFENGNKALEVSGDELFLNHQAEDNKKISEKEWWENGRLKKEIKYENYKKIEEKEWRENGNEKIVYKDKNKFLDSIKHLERFNGAISIYVKVHGDWLEREYWSGEIDGESFKIEADLDFYRTALVNLDLTEIKDKKEIGCTVGHLENKQSIKMVSKLIKEEYCSSKKWKYSKKINGKTEAELGFDIDEDSSILNLFGNGAEREMLWDSLKFENKISKNKKEELLQKIEEEIDDSGNDPYDLWDDPDDIERISENYEINEILIKTGKNKDEADDDSKNKVYEYIP